jgi:hypothetical protein
VVLLGRLVQTALREVVGNGNAAHGQELAGVGLGLEPEGKVVLGDVWEVAGGGVRSFAVSGGFL